MKLAAILACIKAASAHTIFQKVSVNGKEYPPLAGLRAPNQDYPTYDVNSGDLTCGKVALVSNEVIPVAAGDKFGAWWGHVIGGEQWPGDPDHPIAASHHGPVTAWLAKVDDAANAQVGPNLKFFKIAEDNFDVASNTWGVDNMVKNRGWSYFDVPSCIAPGDYLLRVELLALHSAYDNMGAQFYVSCANVRISGDGTFAPTETHSIPGVYKQNDPAILTNIWGPSPGVADNSGKPYQAPGPRPITC
ncbi:related to endoglucanase B [Cephalotrichum gorgonifer]|uniref:lytic cellulose monooxygenase (C4-dehydrogenating) n=1 Tax=Cephalotrichum gorgonifer TaxID=2041049 RepID=A0AAE8SSB2_9PEZI|nr:related to endoglucanase B [Cephalotrichum gorgonifer]